MIFRVLVIVIGVCVSSYALDTASLYTAIETGATFLTEQCTETGQFVYRINMDPEQKVKPKYNLLRHAGSMYALGTAYERTSCEATKQALLRASKFLELAAVKPVPKKDGLLAVWSDRRITHDTNKKPEIKLGGCGLGLVAFCTLKKIDSDAVELSMLQGIGNCILFMQRPGGRFYSKYKLKGGFYKRWTSLYYPGEAALGLIMLYEVDRDERWLRGALDAMLYLARKRKDDENVPPDHWALIATQKLFELEHPLVEKNRNQLLFHAKQICEFILSEQIVAGNPSRTIGGFDRYGRTCPAATRLEGLLAALSFLPKEDKIYHEIEQSVEKGIHFLLYSQIQREPYVGAVPRAVCKFKNPTTQEHKDHNRRAGEIRIDYVQHAISAWIAYKDYVDGKSMSTTVNAFQPLSKTNE